MNIDSNLGKGILLILTAVSGRDIIFLNTMYEKSTRDTYQHEDQHLQQQQHLSYYSLELCVWNFQFLKQYSLNPSKQDKDKKLNIADAPSLPCDCVSVCVVGFLTTNCLCLWCGRPRYWVFFLGGGGGVVVLKASSLPFVWAHVYIVVVLTTKWCGYVYVVVVLTMLLLLLLILTRNESAQYFIF